jgi:hypothetical protein
MKLLEIANALTLRRQFTIFDDFLWYVTAHLWTSLAADSGTSVAVGDAAGGVLVLTTGATDNNEALVKTTNELFLFAVDKPLRGEARVQFAEANTNAANVAFGFADALGANLLLDDGGGAKASFSGALLYKVDGGTTWNFITSVGTTRTVTATAVTAGGASYQTLRIEAREQGGVVEVVPIIDGTQALDANGRPIKHRLDPTSATEMQAGCYVKAGGANSEVLRVDYLSADALR